jgi:hypothetical protein
VTVQSATTITATTGSHDFGSVDVTLTIGGNTVSFPQGYSPSPAFAQQAHYGMNAHDVSARTADKMSELGADIVRVVYGWDVIEPNCKGCFNWSFTDAWRDEARRTRPTIFGSLGYTPRWANGGAAFNTAPLNGQDWYDFVYATVGPFEMRSASVDPSKQPQRLRPHQGP